MRSLLIVLSIGALMLSGGGLIAQSLQPVLPEIPFNYLPRSGDDHRNLRFPPIPDYTPADNPVTNAGAALGRVLFYDRKLSVNDSVSCSSCHKQELAFADDQRFSRGFQGDSTARNSMALFNTRAHIGGFFWDLRAETLEEQALLPIQDDVEMGLTLDSLVSKLSATEYYPPLFTEAFGTPEVNPERIADAISQFERAIVSDRSKYDVGLPIGFTNFTPEEELGRNLFTTFAQPGSSERGANCFLCHSVTIAIAPPAPPGIDKASLFASNGLDLFPSDPGLGGITGRPEHHGTFKTASVRNIELTAPYMHDGRFSTLEEVVDHYDLEIENHVNLHPLLRGLGNVRPMRLDLTADERAALIAFMKTFTDYELIQDPRFSDPFKDPTGITAQGGDVLATDDFQLLANYPNPFNPETTIPFVVQEPGDITLSIFDMTGRKVVDLLRGRFNPGRHIVSWNGSDGSGNPAASGIYVYRLQVSAAGRFGSAAKKMVLLR